MSSTDKQDFERGLTEQSTPVKDFITSIIGACFVLGAVFAITLGFAWAIGADVRTSRTKAAENFMNATRDSGALLEKGMILTGRGEDKTIVAMVSGRKYRDTRRTKITCVFGRDGSVDAYAEVLVSGRWSTNLSNYKVTGKIDEAIARCAHFEVAAQRGMEAAVKDGFWKEIPEFTYH